MKRLNDRVSIEVWKRIADSVQRLNIYDFSDEEFNANLFLLQNELVDLDISLDFLSRYPDKLDEVGLASLLQSIYSANVYNDYKKANFYEKIHQLDELGIPSIEFRPVDFPDFVSEIKLIKDKDANVNLWVNKAFTDGVIDIGYVDSPLDRWYDIENIQFANYIINVVSEINDLGVESIDGDKTWAILKNFNGEYPSRGEIIDVRYPGLCTYINDLGIVGRRYILKQIYYKFNRNNAKYNKRLVRTPNNYHYA